jgi:hypothetical protein
MRRRIIVTDVTEMGAGHFCVAGWDSAASRMVRPLLPGRHGWPASWIGPDRFWPGNHIGFRQATSRPKGEWPHATEDTEIVPGSLDVISGGAPHGWTRGLAASVSPTLAKAFGQAVRCEPKAGIRTRAAVVSGSAVPSLGALIVRPDRLEFRNGPIRDGRPQLRARLTDPDGCYDLPVVAHQLRQHHRKGGTAEVAREIGPGPWHVRLGLARPFNGGKACFVMVNGVYPL